MKYLRYKGEKAPELFAGEIKDFILRRNNTNQYKQFIRDIFENKIDTNSSDPVFTLLKYLEDETDFYVAPASAKYHSNEEYGLVRHSLLVVSNGIKLAPVMLPPEVDMYHLIASCLFHDLCKVNMFETKLRNSKNDETGVWEKVPFYKVKDDYLSCGHGVESMLRLNKFILMPDAWNHAIRWHMGAYDMSQLDKLALDKSLSTYREVLFLQTADMMAGLVENI